MHPAMLSSPGIKRNVHSQGPASVPWGRAAQGLGPGLSEHPWWGGKWVTAKLGSQQLIPTNYSRLPLPPLLQH